MNPQKCPGLESHQACQAQTSAPTSVTAVDGVPPSIANLTVPVGIPPPGASGLIVAENVTIGPKTEATAVSLARYFNRALGLDLLDLARYAV